MKSLLSDFRSCYRAGTSKRRPPSPAQEARTDHAPPSRRLRSPKSESSAGTQWRPALNAISEDGDATPNSSKGRSSSKTTVAQSRSIASIDQVNAPVMIPSAYWATPFMF